MADGSEIWRPVRGYDGYYSVSDRGRVRSEDRVVFRNGGRGPARRDGQIMTPVPHHKTGYLQVPLSRNSKRRWYLVHILVLEAFVGAKPEGMHGAHDNGQNQDNRLSNLLWKTPSENSLDQVRHGTHAMLNREKCPRGHLLVEPNLVRCLLKRGYRDCLSCNRARATRSNKRKREGIEIDWIPLADANYAALMEGVAA